MYNKFCEQGNCVTVEIDYESKPLSPDLGRASVGSSGFFLTPHFMEVFFYEKYENQGSSFDGALYRVVCCVRESDDDIPVI